MLQVFVSYARDDNALPPNVQQKSGFVSTLISQLNYELRNLGPERPRLWYDRDGIDRADLFESVIESQINASNILLVVLSLNWLARDWCLKELESFRKHWSGRDVRRRIVIASKRFVPFEQRPDLLQGQEGYNFFDVGDRPGAEYCYFERGDITDKRYYDQVGELARYLCSFQSRNEFRSAMAPPAAAPTVSPAVANAIPAPSGNRPVRAAGRTIFVAKPAADMRAAYSRLVVELRERGYTIAPEADQEIPIDSTATDMIDRALADADFSVHLLGEKSGYSPEDAAPIVNLQLERAALRSEAPSNGQGKLDRIIWAPQVLTDTANNPASGERDTVTVLGKFGRHVPSDKVVGENLSKFIDFLVQRLETLQVAEAAPVFDADGDEESSVYVYHSAEDQDYALQIARLLKAQKIEPRLPALEGDPTEISALHRQELQNCRSVVLCWANATEAWIKARANELAKWRNLGRTQRFACRAVVAGPPPGMRKRVLADFPPSSEVDVVLNLTDSEKPNADSLAPLIIASRPAAP